MARKLLAVVCVREHLMAGRYVVPLTNNPTGVFLAPERRPHAKDRKKLGENYHTRDIRAYTSYTQYHMVTM